MTAEPRIVGFFCNWCAYRAADLAGALRLAHGQGLRIVRVMCTSRVEPRLVLTAFRAGADGVLVAGCPPGQCHYGGANILALQRVQLLKKMLPQLGIAAERLELAWLTAGEAGILADKVREMTARLKEGTP